VTGADTIIATMPQAFYVELGDGPTLVMQPFARWLRQLSEAQASSLGEQLHHAEFVITTSPSVVQARGSMHDCDECRAGVQAALRSLRDHPDQELLVGALYWAGPKTKGMP
jgi:hypothetical protein